MTIEIKTSTLEPVRQTFAHIERRFGAKPASRYQEATYDVQSESFFHYRPLWEPDKELNDPGRTALVMADWYALKDPRQYYYGTYVQQRAKMQEVAESNYAFFEKRGLAERMSEAERALLIRCVLPLRHLEQAANLNNVYASAYGYGTAITQACLYCGMDRLGIAQYLSRIGLILDGNQGDSLAAAKTAWMDDPLWQPLRRWAENSTCIKDWGETFTAQNLIHDGLLFPLVYERLDARLAASGQADIGMLLEFMQLWFKDHSRWVDAVIKTLAAESDANRAQLSAWAQQWRGESLEALAPLAAEIATDDADLLADLDEALLTRCRKLGLEVEA